MKTVFLLLACGTLTVAGIASASPQSILSVSRDQAFQQIADQAVADAKKKLRPEGMTVVVAEPKSGKILALGGWLKEITPGLQNDKGWVCWEMLEPGSTFKPVVAVAAIETGVISPKTKINCENGVLRYKNTVIRDNEPLGEATVEEILSKSSNIGALKMARMLKDEDLYDYILKFGFGEKSGIPFPDEIKGFVKPPSQWLELTKGHLSAGRSLGVTSIQLAMAYCVIANGGLLMRPTIGEAKPQVVRRVCSQKTADLVKDALRSTFLPHGTVPMAHVEGMTAGGMAARVEAINLKGGDYLPGQFCTLFAGFFPVDEPKYVVIVTVDRAKLPPSKNFGRLVAAPIFSEIAAKITALK